MRGRLGTGLPINQCAVGIFRGRDAVGIHQPDDGALQAFRAVHGVDVDGVFSVGHLAFVGGFFVARAAQKIQFVDESRQTGIASAFQREREFEKAQQIGLYRIGHGIGDHALVAGEHIACVENAVEQIVYRQLIGVLPPAIQQRLCALERCARAGGFDQTA